MSITPLEIRQKSFEKSFRGYEKEGVDAFLQSLSQEWERLLMDNRNQAQRLESAERDVQKLREVESSLYKALKTAEDTKASMIDQANKSAELQVKEAKMHADSIMNDAKSKAKNLLEEAEAVVKEINAELREQIKQVEADFRTIEHQRDNILLEMKNIAKDVKERVNKYSEKKVTLQVTSLLDNLGAIQEREMELKELPTKKEDNNSIAFKAEEEKAPVEFEVNTSFEENKPSIDKEDKKKDETSSNTSDQDSFFDSV